MGSPPASQRLGRPTNAASKVSRRTGCGRWRSFQCCCWRQGSPCRHQKKSTPIRMAGWPEQNNEKEMQPKEPWGSSIDPKKPFTHSAWPGQSHPTQGGLPNPTFFFSAFRFTNLTEPPQGVSSPPQNNQQKTYEKTVCLLSVGGGPCLSTSKMGNPHGRLNQQVECGRFSGGRSPVCNPPFQKLGCDSDPRPASAAAALGAPRRARHCHPAVCGRLRPGRQTQRS